MNFDSSGDIFKVPLKRFEEENSFYDFPVICNSNRENLGNRKKKKSFKLKYIKTIFKSVKILMDSFFIEFLNKSRQF